MLCILTRGTTEDALEHVSVPKNIMELSACPFGRDIFHLERLLQVVLRGKRQCNLSRSGNRQSVKIIHDRLESQKYLLSYPASSVKTDPVGVRL